MKVKGTDGPNPRTGISSETREKPKKKEKDPRTSKRGNVKTASGTISGNQSACKSSVTPQDNPTQPAEARTDAKPWQFQPGNGYAFKPGQSGNLNGRKPKDAKSLAKEFGVQPYGRSGRTADEHFMRLLFQRACSGNMKAAELWAGYRWGRPSQTQVNLNADLSDEEKIENLSDEELNARVTQLLAAHRPKEGAVQ